MVAFPRKTALFRLWGFRYLRLPARAGLPHSLSLVKLLWFLPWEGEGLALAQLPGCSEKDPAMTCPEAWSRGDCEVRTRAHPQGREALDTE